MGKLDIPKFQKDKPREDLSRDKDADGSVAAARRRVERVPHGTGEAREQDAYRANLLIGNVSGEQALEHMVDRLRVGNVYHPAHAELAARVKEFQKAKKQKGEFTAIREKELDQTAILNDVEFYTAAHGKGIAVDTEEFQVWQTWVKQNLLRKYTDLSPIEQRMRANEFLKKFKRAQDPELMRKLIFLHAREQEGIKIQKSAVRDEAFLNTYWEKIEKGSSPEEAFTESLRHASPELQRQFEAYTQYWQSERIQDVFGPEKVSKLKLPQPNQDQLSNAIASYKQAGIPLDLPQGRNYGTFTHEGMLREVAIYLVDEKPRLFIEDPNADRGIRGPLAPDEAPGAMFEMLVDDYFSREFRKNTTLESEKDPTKLLDHELLRLGRGFLTPAEQKAMKLDPSAKILLRNLASLFAEEGISLQEKLGFFKGILRDPQQKVEKARRILRQAYWNDPEDPQKSLPKTLGNFKKLFL